MGLTLTKRKRWRFGVWAYFFLSICVTGIACLLVSAFSWSDNINFAVPVVVFGLALVAISSRVRSRKFVEIDKGNVRVMVSGRQFNTSNDVLFLLPHDPAFPFGFPDSVYCSEGDRTIRLGLLGQNKFWTPFAILRFTRTLDDAEIKWQWEYRRGQAQRPQRP